MGVASLINLHGSYAPEFPSWNKSRGTYPVLVGVIPRWTGREGRSLKYVAPLAPAVAGTLSLAVLRAVNLGPHLRIDMGKLQATLRENGYPEARTWLHTGNLVLPGGHRTGRVLESWLESMLVSEFAAHTEVFARTRAEWQEVLDRNPFAEMARVDPAHLVVMFLRAAPEDEAATTALNGQSGPESMQVFGREAYITYPNGIGRSPLTNSVLERRLGVSGTARNWNTVRRMAALAGL